MLRASHLHLARRAALVALAFAACVATTSCGGSGGAATVSNVSSSSVATQAARPAETRARATTRPPRFSPALQRAFLGFAACMRARGVSMPPPNVTGPGPVFDPKRIGTTSPHFASAESICRTQLLAATSQHR
jgi:hypothetical protein